MSVRQNNTQGKGKKMETRDSGKIKSKKICELLANVPVDLREQWFIDMMHEMTRYLNDEEITFASMEVEIKQRWRRA